MYRRDREQDMSAGFTTGVITGAMVGVGLALLFAPKAGSMLREDIGEGMNSLRDVIGRRYREVAERAGVEIENLQERVERAAEGIESSARELVDAAAERVQRAGTWRS
jgi:gas vesicle protein